MDALRPLKPELAQKATKELNEDPTKIEEELRTLKQWLLEQPNIRARTNNQFLLGILRGCKHRMDKTKKKLYSYYSQRDSFPEIFRNRLVTDSVVEMARLKVALILPKTDGDDGPRIAMIRAAAWNPDRFSPFEMVKFGSMLCDIIFNEDDNTMIAGQIGILDIANVPIADWVKFATPSNIMFGRRALTFGEKVAPQRPKGLHVINVSSSLIPIFNTFKHLIPARDRKLIKLHPNVESLWEHIPQHLLPEEYGGTNSNIPEIADYWANKLLEYRDYFIEEASYGSENPEEVQPYDFGGDIDFGSIGTFRALAVD